MDTQLSTHLGSFPRLGTVNSSGLDCWNYRPATDLTLNFFERNRSLDCERGLARRLMQAGTRVVLRRYFQAAQALRVVGRQNFPTQGPFVIVCNHSSHFDALALAASVPSDQAGQVSLLAAGDTFFSSRIRAAFASIFLNARPVWRGACGGKALGTLRGRLEDAADNHRDGPIMVLFPEGTRSRTGKIARFKAGVGALVAGTEVPVVPCCLSGAHEAWPAGQRLPQRGAITLTIGAAMTFEDQLNDRSGWRVVAKKLEEQVRALSSATTRRPQSQPSNEAAGVGRQIGAAGC